MCHAPDARTFDRTSPAVRLSWATDKHHFVRGFSHAWRRGRRCGVCPVPNQHAGRAAFVVSGPTGAARNWAALSGRAGQRPQTPDADAAFPAHRCHGRSRGGAALQGAGCGGRRNSGRSGGGEFYRDETFGPAGRDGWCALLVDPAGGKRRSECCARPLADCASAVGGKSRRPARTRKSALAGGVVPFARWPAGGMGGTI